MTATVLDLVIPKRLWFTSNSREHWQARRRKTKELRALAAWSARAQGVPTFARAHLVAHVSYPTNGRADPGNVVGTVLKALTDGLVDAGVLPDDDHTHLIGPDPRRGPKTGQAGVWKVRLQINPLPEPEPEPEPSRGRRASERRHRSRTAALAAAYDQHLYDTNPEEHP